MKMYDFITYLLAIPAIESIEMNADIMSSNFSDLKKNAREEITASIRKNQTIVLDEKRDKVLSSEEAALELARLING